MSKFWNGIIKKYWKCIANLVMLVTTVEIQSCSRIWYQDKEPEGLYDYLHQDNL